MHRLLPLVALAFGPVALAGPGPGASETSRQCGLARVGEPAPWLAGWTLDDRVSNLDHLKSMAVSAGRRGLLVVFFATWCEPCRTGLALLARNLDALRDAGVEPVLVDYAEEADEARPFLSRMGLSGVTVVLDRFGKVAQAYGAARNLGGDRWEGSLPKTFLLDASGVVRLIVTKEGRDYLDLVLREARRLPAPPRSR